MGVSRLRNVFLDDPNNQSITSAHACRSAPIQAILAQHQALDMAHTRQWLSGYPELPSELELQGLSPEEMVLLQQILVAISTRTPLPGVTPAPGNGQQYC